MSSSYDSSPSSSTSSSSSSSSSISSNTQYPPGALEQIGETYMRTTIADALRQTLEEMMKDGKLKGPEADKIVKLFFRSMGQRMAEFSQQTHKVLLNLDGRLQMYRYCDGVWVLVVEDLMLSTGTGGRDETVTADAMLFVAKEAPHEAKSGRGR